MVTVVAALLLGVPAPHHRASDVVLIANWVCGKDPAGAFPVPFGDNKFLAESKDPLLYTDISGVDPPGGLKAANYEFVQARMRGLKGGRRAAPAVLIVRSSLDEPTDDGVERAVPAREVARDQPGIPAGRVYYVEVTIGNLAWHWLKVVVHEEGGKVKATVVRSTVS
jgi:hypothetical protein